MSVTDNNPLDGLYAFVRNHLVVVNNIVLTAVTIVGVLDFLAPRLSILPKAIYCGTALLLALMLLAPVSPGAAERIIAFFRLPRPEGVAPMWRRPVWQFMVFLLLVVNAAGFASVARAEQGGLIASQFPAAREWQEQLLALKRIEAGVDALVKNAQHPQAVLTSRGYKFDTDSLAQAIRQHDYDALKLYADAHFRADHPTPLLLLMSNEWDQKSAGLLTEAMFANENACIDKTDGWRQAAFLAEAYINELRPEQPEKAAAFKRLCKSEFVVKALTSMANNPDPNKPQSVIEQRRWALGYLTK